MSAGHKIVATIQREMVRYELLNIPAGSTVPLNKRWPQILAYSNNRSILAMSPLSPRDTVPPRQRRLGDRLFLVQAK